MSEGEKIPNQSQFIEQKREYPKKEKIPRDHIDVGVYITSLGGDGDLSAGAKFVDALRSGSNASHFQTTIYAQDRTPQLLNVFSDQLHDTPIINYTRGAYHERTNTYDHLPQVNGQELHANEDAMIFVCCAPRPELLSEKTNAIIIKEHGGRPMKPDFDTKEIVITTGFKFDPKIKAIQAGLTYSRQFENLLHQAKTEKEKMLRSCEKQLEEKVGREVDLHNPFSLLYTSSLTVNNAYFTLLIEAAQHLKDPLTIVAPVVEKSGDLQLFERRVAAERFNYVADGEKIDRGSNVTVVNPHRIPSELFQKLGMLSSLPGVVTGDQSLTEAVQRASSSSRNPFLVYTLPSKQIDFLDHMHKIDPYMAKLLGSYYQYEIPEEHWFYSLSGSSLQKRLAPYTSEHQRPQLEDIARLFYDQQMISRFNDAAAEIPKLMKKEREGYIDNPEVLCDATKTVESLLESIRMNDLEEGVKQFIPH